MKITFKECLSKSEWLYKELLQSLTTEVFHTIKPNEDFYDVKLVVNGVEIEPVWFNSIMTKFDEHIKAEARIMFNDYLDEIDLKPRDLESMINEITEKMRDKFDNYSSK